MQLTREIVRKHSAWSESRGELYPREWKKLGGSTFPGIVISWKHIQLNNIIRAIFHTLAILTKCRPTCVYCL